MASGEWTGLNNTGTSFTAGMEPLRNRGEPPRRRWRRQGPKEGEKETLQRNEKTYYWCGKCRLWNTTHRTAEHIRGGPKTQESNIPQNSVNVAAATAPTPLSSQPSDQPIAFQLMC